MIREVAHVGTIWLRKGAEIRVSLKDAGGEAGTAVDVREYSTEDAEPTYRKVGNTWQARDPYVGPTKRGLWLTLGQAELVVEEIAHAIVKALEIEAGSTEAESPGQGFSASGGFDDEAQFSANVAALSGKDGTA